MLNMEIQIILFKATFPAVIISEISLLKYTTTSVCGIDIQDNREIVRQSTEIIIVAHLVVG